MSIVIGEAAPLCTICNRRHHVMDMCYKPRKVDVDCLGKSQTKCTHCGKCHGIFETCKAKEVYVAAKEPLTLDMLYTELGTADWIGSRDSDWNEAIDAVRRYIRNNK